MRALVVARAVRAYWPHYITILVVIIIIIQGIISHLVLLLITITSV